MQFFFGKNLCYFSSYFYYLPKIALLLRNSIITILEVAAVEKIISGNGF